MTETMSAEAGLSTGREVWRPTRRQALAERVRQARRHSRVVRMLRIGIPVGVLAGLCLYGLSGWLNPFSRLPGLDMAGIVISRSQVSIERPRMAGYTRDGRPYELVAAGATQDLAHPNFIDLKGIRGTVELPGGELVKISAGEGRYDTKTEIVTVRDNVIVVMTDGAEIRMAAAEVDARSGRVISERDVEVVSQGSRLNARQMEVSEGGAVATFRGGVVMDVAQPVVRADQGGSQ